MLAKPTSAAFGIRRPSCRPVAVARRTVQPVAAVKIYTNPGSRGKIAEWYAAELGLDVELVELNMRSGDHKSDWFLKINPFGKVPAMEDGDVKLFESGAILMYLANKYGKLSVEQMATVGQWTLFANSTLCETLFNEQRRNAQGPAMLGTINDILASKPYLDGEEFSVSDIAVGAYLLYLPIFFPSMDLSKYPAMWEYMTRLVARPACPAPYQEAMKSAMASKQGGLGDILSKLGVK